MITDKILFLNPIYASDEELHSRIAQALIFDVEKRRCIGFIDIFGSFKLQDSHLFGTLVAVKDKAGNIDHIAVWKRGQKYKLSEVYTPKETKDRVMAALVVHRMKNG